MALDQMASQVDSDNEAAENPDVSPDRLMEFAQANGDICDLLSAQELADLGQRVVEDWEFDRNSNNEWRTQAEEALAAAAQDRGEGKNYPWDLASNIKYPTLTVAAQQFAARAYPAIVRNDEAVGCKVLGLNPEFEQSAQMAAQPQQPQMPEQPPQQAPQGPDPQAMAAWKAKKDRAERVAKYLNFRLFYGMQGWEEDIDVLLNQLPIVGMGFKKVYKSAEYGICSEFVSALHLTVHRDTRDLATCPRITHDFTKYPYELRSQMNLGFYRDVKTVLQSDTDDDQQPREILEQFRMHDLDGDDVPEPYIITVDRETCEVLRIEAVYGPEDVLKQGNNIVSFKRTQMYVPFPFMPDPKGGFYGIGFGKLLSQITAAINTSFNQLVDAGHAMTARGGFIASGVRIQNGGQGSTLRFKPGEYKTVGAAAGTLKDSVYDFPVPAPSPVTFNMLDMLLAAAKDISSVKDVLTGDAPANAPVGTTMALIEQGLQQFTAIYKRIYRSLKAEFKLLYEYEARYGGEESQQDYTEFFDGDPQANFEADFTQKGYDITPVSDPRQVTAAQRLAKAQFAQQFIALPFANGPKIMLRALEAAEIDDPQELIAAPAPPNPMQIAEYQKTQSETQKNLAQATNYMAEAGVKTGEAEANGAINAGAAHELSQPGGLPAMAGQPDNAMGGQGAPSPIGGGAPAVPSPDMGAQSGSPDEGAVGPAFPGDNGPEPVGA